MVCQKDNLIVSDSKVYHCGTLTYTKASLAMLFLWLLWGAFCFSMMEAVVPSILPLKLKEIECPKLLIGIITTALPSMLNITVCPWISFKSDRFRGKWGRRIPFMLFSLPFICISLGLIGWSGDISMILQYFVPYAPATITISIIVAFVVIFQFFNMFVGSVFYYIFNDVVPVNFLARFIVLFRIASLIASALYNYFIFQYSASHMREIFTGAAILYCVGFGLMCLMIKEEKYPPVEGESDKDNRGLGGLKTFFKQSYTNKFFWIVFLITSFQTATGAIGTFNIFFYKHMGLTWDDIIKINTVGFLSSTSTDGYVILIFAVFSAIIMYIAAIFIDRWHPLRVCVYGAVFGFITICMGWLWIFIDIPASFYFWLCIAWGGISFFQYTIVSGALSPLRMRLFPKSRFGQFCTAETLVDSLFWILSGILVGIYLDSIKYFCNGSDFAYRFIVVWQIVCSAISMLFFILAYREWYRLGGDKNFHVPASWSPDGLEKMPISSTVGPQSRWLKISLNLFHCRIIISVMAIPIMMYWMYYKHASSSLLIYAILLFPLAVTAWFCWRILEKNIRQDMQRSINGEPLENGIPHHGMMMIATIKFIMLSGVWAVQIIVSINLNLETATIFFGIANVATDFMLIAGVWFLARIERGHLVTLDKSLA